MRTLWFTCGLPGSGKSTWLEKNVNANKVVSRDKIRFHYLNQNDDYFDHENLVWQDFVRTIREKSLCYEDVFIDATHLNEKSRNKILRALNINTDAVNINWLVFDVDLKTCLRRNEKRQGRARVPDYVLVNMNKIFDLPTFDESYEYNKIYYIDEDGECK